jgi:subtilisin family serine protease
MANGSFGIPYAQVIEDALAAAPDLLLTVSAGNNSWNVDEHPEARYPCISTLPNVICVAASDQADNLVGWSNWSPRTVDLAAPGVDIPSLTPPDRWIRIEDFDTELDGRWVTGGPGVQWGRVPDPYWPGGILEDSPGEPYANDSDSWIAMTGSVDLTGYERCVVSMSMGYQLASGDVFRIEASDDQTPWTTINKYEGGGTWPESGDLSAFDGRPGVKLRFRLTTNASGQSQGVQVDRLGLYCIFAPFRGTEYANVAGTSFAAPHVAGVGGLILSREPDLTAPELRARLLGSVDTIPSMAGKTVTGGRLNARRALGLPEPPPGATASGEHETPAEPQPAADRSAPLCKLRVQRRRSIAGVRRRGLRVGVRCNERGRLSARLLVDGVRIGAVATRFDVPGSKGLRLPVRRRFAKLLRGARVAAVVELVAKDGAGNQRTKAKRLVVRR